MKPDAPKTVVDFANDYPDFMWLWEYLSSLAENVPKAFLEPPSEELTRYLAGSFATRNYWGAYVAGGYQIAHMVLAEFERLERFEQCAEIQQAIEEYHSAFYETHKAARERHGHN